VSARNSDSSFVEMLALLEEEKRVATEFLRLTVHLAALVAEEKLELIEGVLAERQQQILRSDELKTELDLYFLALRGKLSPQGLAVYHSSKEEVASIWRSARDQDKAVEDAMKELLEVLREKVKEAQQGKKGHRAYVESERMTLGKQPRK